MRLPGQRPNAGMHALSQGSEYTIRNNASTTFQAVDEFVFSNTTCTIVDGGLHFTKMRYFGGPTETAYRKAWWQHLALIGVVLGKVPVTFGIHDCKIWVPAGQSLAIFLTSHIVQGTAVVDEMGRLVDKRSSLGKGAVFWERPKGFADVDDSESIGI